MIMDLKTKAIEAFSNKNRHAFNKWWCGEFGDDNGVFKVLWSTINSYPTLNIQWEFDDCSYMVPASLPDVIKCIDAYIESIIQETAPTETDLEKRLHNAEMAIVGMNALLTQYLPADVLEAHCQHYFNASKTLGAFESKGFKTK